MVRLPPRRGRDSKVGYRTTGDQALPVITALSLGMLRRRIEAALMPDEVIVVLSLDKAAKRERDRRRSGGEQGRERMWPR